MKGTLFNKRLAKQISGFAELLEASLDLLAAVWIVSHIKGITFQFTIELQVILYVMTVLWIFVVKVTEDTGINRSGNCFMIFFEILKMNIISSLALLGLVFLLSPGIGIVWVLVFIPLNILVLFCIRLVTVKLLKVSRIWGHDIKKVILIADEGHEKTVFSIMDKKEWGYQVVYILTDSSKLKHNFRQQSRIYPKKANIRSLLRHDIVDEIILLSSNQDHGYIQNLSVICRDLGVNLLLYPLLTGHGSTIPRVYYIGKIPFTLISNSPRIRLSYHFKTALEMLFASSALFVLSPLLLFIAVLIKLDSSGPVLFKQQRVGLRGRKFYIYKFRTMITDAEQLKDSLKAMNESEGPVFKIKNDPRITTFGLLLRKTGLDELPQLFNVMKGEMSLIGPRPLLPSEAKEHKAWHLKRMSVKPGITCTWQVEAERNKVPFDKWMNLDLDYIENWSVKADFILFFRTLKSLFQAKGL